VFFDARDAEATPAAGPEARAAPAPPRLEVRGRCITLLHAAAQVALLAPNPTAQSHRSRCRKLCARPLNCHNSATAVWPSWAVSLRQCPSRIKQLGTR
jgi:hypothetical protein